MAGISDLVCGINNSTEFERLSEFSDTDSYSTSSSFTSHSDDDYEPVWLEKVGSRGSLLYIEPEVSFDNSSHNCNEYEVSSSSSKSIPKQAKSKLNAAEKLKKWMRKRRKKVRKSFPLLSLENMNSITNESDGLYFNSNIKEFFVEIDSSKLNSRFCSTLSSELLGIAFKQDHKFSDESKNQLIISDFVSFKDVYKINDIKLGDCLKSINDIEVTPRNLDEVLANVASTPKVKLTMECTPVSSISHHNTFKQPSDSHILIKELLGDASVLEQSKSKFLHIPHGIFYLSIDNEMVVEKDGVVYRYPDVDTPLFQQKGMFITLAHMIADVASPPLLNCSLMIQGELVHIGYMKEEKEVMIFALPASCSNVSEAQHFASNIAKLLRFQFSSLGRAFGQINAKHLDHFFILFFRHVLSTALNQNKCPPHLISILPSVQWIPLPADLKTEIDDVLNELESADFGCSSKGFYGNQRIFSILGSCLFYKGYLLANHLPRSDLLDIHLYLQYHQMLRLTQTQSVSQFILWKEVNPSHRQASFTLPDSEFKEVEGRWFFLIVAMKHCILAVLLEAGGCSLRVEGYPAPEPFYVEEVQNTLIILEECGIIDAINKSFHLLLPPLASPDQFMKEGNSAWNSFSSLFASGLNITSSTSNLSRLNHSLSFSSLPLDKAGTKKSSEIGILDRSDEIDYKRHQILSTIGPADGESDMESNYSEDSRENLMHHQKTSRSHSISTGSTSESFESSEFSSTQSQVWRQSFSNNYDLSSPQSMQEDDLHTNENRYKIVTGSNNTLFQYLHMDPMEGIFLAPIQDNHDFLYGPIHQEVLCKFHRCCLEMRTVFERSLRNEEIKKSGFNTKFGLNDLLQATYEQGVLFQYMPKDSSKNKNSEASLNFWVIGRLFFAPEPREIYVCYHDSSQQDMVEMAFRLGFGLSL